jgi:DNA-binding NarL/FixJ family response regulator
VGESHESSTQPERDAIEPKAARGVRPTRAQRAARERKATARELRSTGLRYKEIAARLKVAERTVYTYFEDDAT